MRLDSNFENVINHENASLEADLKCSCGSKVFNVFHSGVQKKTLFGRVYVSKKQKQLIIKSKCSKCGKEYLVYDSTIDGVRPKGNPIYEFTSLEINGVSNFNLRLIYNFYEENYNTEKFEMFRLDVKPESSEKYIVLVEE